MIENVMNRAQQDRQRAKRIGIAPSKKLQKHFVALARQVRRWAAEKSPTVRPLAIGVTSLNGGSGTSTISYNLSASLCSTFRSRTLLVESNFGKHFITRRLGQARSAGLSELLVGLSEIEDTIHETPITDLEVMGCGQRSDQEVADLPFEILPTLMTEKLDRYGYIVFDLPVANHLTAYDTMAPQLDGIILTVDAHQIDHAQIKQFRNHADKLGVKIIGIVINKL